MNKFQQTLAIGFIAIATPTSADAQKGSIGVLKSFHIKSDGGWDYLALSPVNNNLYISHGTQINILDRSTGDSVGIIRNTNGVHGIAFAPEYKKGFVSNGKLNNVFVFDIKTNKILDSIKTGINPDFIFYDSYSKNVFVGNGKSGNSTVIDPATNKVKATINLDGKPEAIVSDGDGQIYVVLEDKNEIAVISTKTMNVNKRFTVAPGVEPGGLAIDNKTHHLFAGCGNKK